MIDSKPFCGGRYYTLMKKIVKILAKSASCCLSAVIIGCASISTPEHERTHVEPHMPAGAAANFPATGEQATDVAAKPRRVTSTRNDVVYRPNTLGDARPGKSRALKPSSRVKKIIIPAPASAHVSRAVPSAPMEPVDGLTRPGAVEDTSKTVAADMIFHVPSSMVVRRPQRVQLIVDLPAGDELQRMTEAGPGQEPRIRFSEHMQARLAGAGLSIKALTPEDQPIARREQIRWQWTVQPSAVGLHYLYLTLAAVTNIDGTPLPTVTIATFDKVIEVKDWSPHQQAVAFIMENWSWLCALVLLPLPLWVWGTRRRRSSPTNPFR